MIYNVEYRLYTTAEDKQKALDGINELNEELNITPCTIEELPDTSDFVIIARDAIDMKNQLKNYYHVDEEDVVSIKIEVDDSQELLKDIDILSIADKQETTCSYDWNSYNVLDFARRIIQAYEKTLAEKIDASES